MKRAAALALALSITACNDADITTGWTAVTGASVIDGDTFRLGESRYRLAHIDAPELPGHCRPGRICAPGDPYAARNALSWYLSQTSTYCHALGIDYYHRVLVECILKRSTGDNISINAALVDQGYAIPYHYTGHRP